MHKVPHPPWDVNVVHPLVILWELPPLPLWWRGRGSDHFSCPLQHLIICFLPSSWPLCFHFSCDIFLANPHVHLHIFISATLGLLFCWVVNGRVLSHMAGCTVLPLCEFSCWLLMVFFCHLGLIDILILYSFSIYNSFYSHTLVYP